MSKEYNPRIARIEIRQKDSTLENATIVSINGYDDGEYIQLQRGGEGFAISPAEWIAISNAVELLLREIDKDEQ